MNMNCESAKEQLMDWLSNQMPENERKDLETHLSACSECQEELNDVRQVWLTMGKMPVPEPSEQMHIRFYSMLEEFKEVAIPHQRPAKGWLQQLRNLWQSENISRLAYSFLLVGMGLAGGYWLSMRKTPDVAYQQQISNLTSEMQEMRQLMLLTLLENPSATERLKAVGYTKEIKRADEKVLDALLSTLNNDPNVNVRLVTLEALYELANDPKVREGLVQSITRQESPMVQSALVDMMVTLQEKRSVKPLRELLKEKKLNAMVKGKIEKSIKVLI